MQDTTQQNLIVAYKSGALNENQGFVTPVLFVNDDNSYTTIDKSLYPVDIIISRGYSDVDAAYDNEELFLLKTHFKDEQKTLEAGSPRYWAKGDAVCSLASGTMLPVFSHALP